MTTNDLMHGTICGTASRSRRSERGAAVFVVTLVITLLTSLGIFAVKASGLANRSSGYSRQLTQTHHVTDMAVMTTVGDLSSSLHEAHHILENRPPAGNQMRCEAMPYQEKPKCMILSYTDLDLLDPAITMNRPAVPDTTHGSLGPGDLVANAWIEITDPIDVEPPAGYALAGGAEDTQQQKFELITISVTGVVQPRPAGMNDFSFGATTSAGFERQRLRVRMGPILMQQ